MIPYKIITNRLKEILLYNIMASSGKDYNNGKI
jgi:hypothetical protein